MARTIGSHGPTTLEAIRRAGLRLIYQHGYEGMNLRQLAHEVGIQAGSLYNHIPNKQTLLFDIIYLHLEEVLHYCREAIRDIDDPVTQMKSFIAFHVHHHIDRTHDVYVGYFELRSLDAKNYQIITQKRRDYEQIVVGIIERGISRGAFSVLDARIAAYGILGMLTGVCTWFRPDGPRSAEEVVATYTGIVLSGLSSDGLTQPTPSLP